MNIHWDSVNQIHVGPSRFSIRGAVLDPTERGGPGIVSKSVNVPTPTPPQKNSPDLGKSGGSSWERLGWRVLPLGYATDYRHVSLIGRESKGLRISINKRETMICAETNETLIIRERIGYLLKQAKAVKFLVMNARGDCEQDVKNRIKVAWQNT